MAKPVRGRRSPATVSAAFRAKGAGARSPSRVAMSPPSRERDGHHMAHSRQPLSSLPVLLLALVAAACAPAGASPAADASPPPATASPTPVAAFPAELTDDADRTVT